MEKKIYELKINLDKFPAGSVVVKTDTSWLIGSSELNTRGSIGEGELALLFDLIVAKQLTSIMEEI